MIARGWHLIGLLLLVGAANAQVNTTLVAEGDLRLVGAAIGRGSDLLTAGGWHSLGRNAFGEPVGWGRNDDDQSVVPPGIHPVQFAAGHFHSVARLADGSVVTWGDGPDVPLDLPASQWIAAGRDFTCSIATTGDLTCWGVNSKGQASPPAITDAVEVHCGQEFGIAIREDRSLAIWGSDQYDIDVLPPNIPPYAWQVATGASHVAMIAYNGQVWAWGDNTLGESVVPPGLGFVRSIAAGLRYTAALSDDTLAIWGRWPWPEPEYSTEDFVEIERIEGGQEHLLVIFKDGHVEAWGSPTYGAAIDAAEARAVTAMHPGQVHHTMGRGEEAAWLHFGDRTHALHLPQSTVVGPIESGASFGVGLTAWGEVRLWGSQAPIWFQNRPTDAGYTQLAAGNLHALAWKPDGTLAGMGRNSSGQIQSLPPTVLSAAAAGNGTALVLPDGSLTLQGAHGWGAPPADLPALQSIDASADHLVGLTASGELVAFGTNCGAACENLPAGPFTSAHAAAGVTIGRRADGSVAWVGDERYAGMDDWLEVEAVRTGPGLVCGIVPLNLSPYLTREPDGLLIDICAGRTDSLDLASYFADPEGDSLAYSLIGGPASQLDLSPAGVLTFTGTGAGLATHEVTVRASDPEGLSAELNVQLRERPALDWQQPRLTLAGDREVESRIVFPIGHPFPVTTRLAEEVLCPTYEMPGGGYGVMTPKVIHGSYRFSVLEDDLGCTSTAGITTSLPAVRE